MELLEKIFASPEAQQLLINALLGVIGWIAFKVKGFMSAQIAKAELEKKQAAEAGEHAKFVNTKVEFLRALEMGVLGAEQTVKKEIKAKYEGDHKITGAEAEEIWVSVYTDAWNSMKSQDRELLAAGIEDVKAFAKTAIHGNLTKLKAIKLSKS